MKHWLETRQVLERLAELQKTGQGAALATVVRVRGSAYRHEGAKMVVAGDGSTVGNVSGGCLEADVREVALQVLKSGAVERREYCASSDEVSAWDLGVGCEGMVEILVHREGEARVREFAQHCLASHVPFAVCTDLSSGTSGALTASAAVGALSEPVARHVRSLFADGVSGIHEIGGRETFVDVFTPPPTLVVISAGDDARHVARVATDVGFRVVVVDRRSGMLTRDRFPRDATLVECEAPRLRDRVPLDGESYAVVMTHNYADDREYVRSLLASPVHYIGMLGPRQRTERILLELGNTGPVDEDRIYGPVGLDIGTDGAEQVALAVIGEILAVRSGRRPTSLRERQHPIHADHTG